MMRKPTRKIAAVAAKIANPMANPTHKGARTHNQDHVMNPVNFKTMNAIVRRPKKLVPPDILIVPLFSIIF